MSDDLDSMLKGGGGPPVAKFPNKGDSVEGTVVRHEVRQATDIDRQPKTWPDGNAVRELVITLDTADGPARDILSEDKQAWYAFREAVNEAGGEFLKGSHYKRTFTSEKAPEKAGRNPQKLFTIEYTPADKTVRDIDDLV